MVRETDENVATLQLKSSELMIKYLHNYLLLYYCNFVNSTVFQLCSCGLLPMICMTMAKVVYPLLVNLSQKRVKKSGNNVHVDEPKRRYL